MELESIEQGAAEQSFFLRDVFGDDVIEVVFVSQLDCKPARDLSIQFDIETITPAFRGVGVEAIFCFLN